MTTHPPRKQDIQIAYGQFLALVAIAVGTILVIHFLPKNPTSRNSARLVYTIVYFAAWLALCVILNQPRAYFQNLYYCWVFEDAPLALERCWRRYLFSLNEIIRIYSWIVGTFLVSTFAGILAEWFPALVSVSLLYNAAWWLSIVAFALVPFFGGALLQEVSQRWRTLREQRDLLPHFPVRNLHDLYLPGNDVPKPINIGKDGSFQAGGIRWTWDMLVNHVVVFGQPASGKTSCVLTSMLEGIIASGDHLPLAPGGLVLDPKGDFLAHLKVLCKRYGRKDDLLVIDPNALRESIRWNPFDCADDELELAGRFIAVMENLGMKGGDSTFWIEGARKFIRHAIALVRMTNPPHQPPTFRDIQRLATSLRAVDARLSHVRAIDTRSTECLHFFKEDWGQIEDGTRTSTAAHITNMIDPFLMDPYVELFSGRSTFRVEEMIEQGKILYLHMPLGGRELMARTIGVLVKLEYFKEIRKRTLTKSRPTFFFCDEYQTFFTATDDCSDADFFDKSRQARHGNIIASQSMPNLRKYCDRPDVFASLMALCITKIFLQNSEPETNNYASNLFGQHLVSVGGSGGSVDAGRWYSTAQSASVSDQYDAVVRPERFTTLIVPSKTQSIPFCEAIVFTGGTETDRNVKPKVKWRRHEITPEGDA